MERRYIRKAAEVVATQLETKRGVQTPRGIADGLPGDFLVRNKRGQCAVVPKEDFEADYEAKEKSDDNEQ